MTSAKIARAITAWCATHRTPFAYKDTIHAKPSLNGLKIRDSAWEGFSSSAHKAGVSVSAVTPEMTTAVATVTANLLVEPAGEATKEGHRDEDRAQHQFDRDDGAGHLAQDSIAASLGERPFSAIEPLDVLPARRCVVHDDAGASTIANKVNVLIEKTERIQAGERPDERNRHGDEGNERGAPALQEHEHHASTSRAAMKRVWITSLIDACTKRVVSKG